VKFSQAPDKTPPFRFELLGGPYDGEIVDLKVLVVPGNRILFCLKSPLIEDSPLEAYEGPNILQADPARLESLKSKRASWYTLLPFTPGALPRSRRTNLIYLQHLGFFNP